MPSLRIIFAGGGTGGHLFPAIAIADKVKEFEPDAEILFVGTKNKIEAQVVPKKGYKFRAIWISGFHRTLRISNLLFPVKVVVSFMQALSLMKNFKPDVVVGTGGYVSGPVLRAALMMKIPTLIQEQNSYPGITTRLLADKVNEVHLTFENSKKYFLGLKNIFITGNPTRNDLESVNSSKAFAYFCFDTTDRMKTLLVFGGSLGARTLNNAVERSLDQLIKHNVRVIWQTGKESYVRAKGISEKYSKKQIWVNTFIERMDYAYAVSDLVVCRAGATTLAELARLGKPAILVPYPQAAANHQVENALSLAQVGAAEIVYDHEIETKFLTLVLNLFEETRLLQMSKNSKRLGRPSAATEIAHRIIYLAKDYGRS